MSTASHLNIKSNHTPYIITGSSLFLLSGFLTLSFLQPFSIDNSYATDNDTTVNIAPNLSISATDVSITDTPESSGSWLTGTSSVVVSTNNETGYKLYMSSNDSQVDLVNTDNSNYKIANLSTETTESTFKSDSNLMNHYGFTHDNNGSNTELGQITVGTYLPITDINNSRLINATTEKQNISTTNVTFATKVDRSIPAGEYTNTITFTAIANPIPNTLKQAAEKAGITTMQTMTKDVCAAADVYQPDEEDLTLTDSRDNNTYKVRKLADGNCWMVQNLRLTRDTLSAAGNTTGSLTSSNTNVSSDKTLPAVNSSFCTDNNVTCYNTLNHMDSGSAEYGAYYSWSAATLDNTVGSKSSGNVETSICPKSGSGSSYADSWHLPTGNTNGEWYNMMTKYTDGVSNFTAGAANTRRDFTDETITGTKNNYGNYTPNFPFSGGWSGSSTSNQGSRGYFWSSTARNTDRAYNALVDSDGYVYAGTDNYYKKYGRSVRCVLSSS